MTDFICDTCQKQFKLKRTLLAHQMIHTGEKPYECEQCTSRFRQYSSLQKHQRTHSGAKPYECDQCKQSFSQISNLKRHQKKHSNEKPYKCDECGKQFITSQNFQQHNTKHQQDRKQYPCESGCGKTYLYQCSLKKHEKEMHKQQQKVESMFTIDSLNVQVRSLKDFFTCSHPQIIHQNHVDVLFNGCLYYYNEENGKIECHELTDQSKHECEPVRDHQHFKKMSFAQVDCSECPQGQCNCCLAQQVTGEKQYPSSQLLHFHGPSCGHPIVYHNGHIDYLVNEMLHYPHEGHCDNHGILNRIMVQ